MKTGNEKMDAILTAIATGKTVCFCTMTRAISVSMREVHKFSRVGCPLFKWNDKSIWMASGKKFTCIDYCKISVWE